MNASPNTTERFTPTSHVFDRVLVGIDGSEASVVAAHQAAVLTEHPDDLALVGVYPAMPGMGFDLDLADDREVDEARARSEEAVAAACTAIASLAAPRTTIVRGRSWEKLIEEATDAGCTLVVVGSHGQRRIEGILGASTATELIHKAPCSVLVARPASERFPQRIVVGLDGSPGSQRAHAAARRLADAHGSVLWPVVAHGGKPVDLAAVVRLTDHHHEELPDDPVTALVAASADADLVVVGSRGLHGLQALGSVSERVAHRAHCSTLVVREPAADVVEVPE